MYIVSLFLNYPKAISLCDIIQYAYGYTFHKNMFFHNFLKKRRNFFTIFKQNDAIFSQFSKETTQFFTIGLVPDPFTILEKKR